MARQTILGELSQSPKGKKELKTTIKAKDPTLKKHFMKALKYLLREGEIEKDGKMYKAILSEKPAIQTVPTSENSKEALPIALRLRKEMETAPKKTVQFAEDEVDLDDEIRRLETELNQQSSSGETDDEESSGENERAVVSLSAYADDKIDHLPKTFLPEPGRYDPRNATASSTKKKKNENKYQKQGKTDGLKEAVQEVLNGYKARSSERLPFYCRFCTKQYNNEDEFFEHKNSDFHKTAVEMERKATFCRLCMKQLTSPEQMKEHLTSRPHRERLQAVRNRQRMEANGDKERRGRSIRQWS